MTPPAPCLSLSFSFFGVITLKIYPLSKPQVRGAVFEPWSHGRALDPAPPCGAVTRGPVAGSSRTGSQPLPASRPLSASVSLPPIPHAESVFPCLAYFPQLRALQLHPRRPEQQDFLPLAAGRHCTVLPDPVFFLRPAPGPARLTAALLTRARMCRRPHCPWPTLTPFLHF